MPFALNYLFIVVYSVLRNFEFYWCLHPFRHFTNQQPIIVHTINFLLCKYYTCSIFLSTWFSHSVSPCIGNELVKSQLDIIEYLLVEYLLSPMAIFYRLFYSLNPSGVNKHSQKVHRHTFPSERSWNNLWLICHAYLTEILHFRVIYSASIAFLMKWCWSADAWEYLGIRHTPLNPSLTQL